jgi:hypothetical protein
LMTTLWQALAVSAALSMVGENSEEYTERVHIKLWRVSLIFLARILDMARVSGKRTWGPCGERAARRKASLGVSLELSMASRTTRM